MTSLELGINGARPGQATPAEPVCQPRHRTGRADRQGTLQHRCQLIGSNEMRAALAGGAGKPFKVHLDGYSQLLAYREYVTAAFT